jgi:4-cresol dehydrogenase (hydroxylating)
MTCKKCSQVFADFIFGHTQVICLGSKGLKGMNEELNNTLGIKRTVYGHFKPKSLTELRATYKILKSGGIKISTYSRGNNWGYGCHSPQVDNMAVIGLAALNEILDFDAYHGVITLEPGVSYGQLAKYLESHGDEWIAPVHGGGPDCSVVGNILERGYGLTPKTDHFGAITCLEAILEDGSMYRGALTELGQPRLDKLFRYGIGPYMDGAFTQSGLGIVTQISLRLARKPAYTEMFYINLLCEDELSDAIEIVKKLKRDLGDLAGGVNFISRERALSMIIEYPYEKIKNGMPLSLEEINIFSKDSLVSPWLIVGALYGEKKLVKQSKKILKSRFKKLKTRKLFYSTSNKVFLKKISELVPRIGKLQVRELVSKLDDAFQILMGKPKKLALKLAYWKHEDRKRLIAGSMNPTNDKCGIIWYAPLVEMKPHKVLEYVSFIRETSKKFGMNNLITLTTIDDLCFDSTIPIIFNKTNEDQKKKAWAYYHYLLKEGAKLGFYPYRLNIDDQATMANEKILGQSKLLKKVINNKRYIGDSH